MPLMYTCLAITQITLIGIPRAHNCRHARYDHDNLFICNTLSDRVKYIRMHINQSSNVINMAVVYGYRVVTPIRQ